jgi:hypothetical protein
LNQATTTLTRADTEPTLYLTSLKALSYVVNGVSFFFMVLFAIADFGRHG